MTQWNQLCMIVKTNRESCPHFDESCKGGKWKNVLPRISVGLSFCCQMELVIILKTEFLFFCVTKNNYIIVW